MRMDAQTLEQMWPTFFFHKMWAALGATCGRFSTEVLVSMDFGRWVVGIGWLRKPLRTDRCGYVSYHEHGFFPVFFREQAHVANSLTQRSDVKKHGVSRRNDQLIGAIPVNGKMKDPPVEVANCYPHGKKQGFLLMFWKAPFPTWCLARFLPQDQVP